jgi:DNA-binding response OmpR family regulator
MKNKKLIFLVEKDFAIIDVYSMAFKRAGFDIETATSGGEALSKIKNIVDGKDKKPDIILLNVVLPDGNVVEVLEKLKSEKITKNIPIFILSLYDIREYPEISKFKTEKFIIKLDVMPTKLVELVEEELKMR